MTNNRYKRLEIDLHVNTLNVHLLELILCLLWKRSINLILLFLLVPEWPYWLHKFEGFIFFSKKFALDAEFKVLKLQNLFVTMYFSLVATFSLSTWLSFKVYNWILKCFIRFWIFVQCLEIKVYEIWVFLSETSYPRLTVESYFQTNECLNECLPKCLLESFPEVKNLQ